MKQYNMIHPLIKEEEEEEVAHREGEDHRVVDTEMIEVIEVIEMIEVIEVIEMIEVIEFIEMIGPLRKDIMIEDQSR